MIITHLYFRWIQLLESGFAVQTWILILLDSNLHAMLYVGHCIVGILLVGSRCCTSSCITWCHYTPDNGNTNFGYQCLITPSIIHKSHWCMDGSVLNIRLWSAAGVCARQLCIAFRLVSTFFCCCWNCCTILCWLFPMSFSITLLFFMQ